MAKCLKLQYLNCPLETISKSELKNNNSCTENEFVCFLIHPFEVVFWGVAAALTVQVANTGVFSQASRQLTGIKCVELVPWNIFNRPT